MKTVAKLDLDISKENFRDLFLKATFMIAKFIDIMESLKNIDTPLERTELDHQAMLAFPSLLPKEDAIALQSSKPAFMTAYAKSMA